MTREHKLSLVLGFGLLLFVGILLSDHFSAAQRREHANLAINAPDRGSRALTDGITIQPLPAAQRIALTGMGQYSAEGTYAAGEQSQVLGGAVPVAPAPVSVPAELYTIKAGESLYKICQTRYGDGSLWKSLAEFNKNVIPNPTKLKAGVTIRIPSASVLRGETPSVASQSYPAAGAVAQMGGSGTSVGGADVSGMSAGYDISVPVPAAQPVQPEIVTPSVREYTVQKGDTLSTIASKRLGSKSKWKQLADANRDRLSDPHNLVPGTVIRLPSN
jgi:nucleoid-associated protein YgaU